MKKYPDVLNASEFAAVVKDKPGLTFTVQPKCDGSNVLKFGDSLYTRNLLPLKQANPKLYSIFTSQYPEILQCKHDFFFELGGRANSPAGYRDSWDSDYDYRVFDAYSLSLSAFKRIVSECKLKAVEILYEGQSLSEAIMTAVRFVNSHQEFEGAVIKAYWHDSMIAVGKVKRNNVKHWVDLAQGKAIEEKGEGVPLDELRAWTHKAFLELSATKDPKSITTNDVWPYVKQEIVKHGYDLHGEKWYREVVRQMLREIKRSS